MKFEIQFNLRQNISAAALIMLFSGCSHQAAPTTAAPMVLTARVTTGAVDTTSTYSGEVRARFETRFTARRMAEDYVNTYELLCLPKEQHLRLVQ